VRQSQVRFRLRLLGLAALAAIVVSTAAGATAASAVQEALTPAEDRYLIRFPRLAVAPEGAAEAAAAPVAPRPGGRLILFFVPDLPRWSGIDPIEGPFLHSPQPTASIEIATPAPGTELAVDPRQMTVFRGPLEELRGAYRVQAVLDLDFTERGHLGPGNLVSEPIQIELSPDREDEVVLELSLGPSGSIAPHTPPSVDGVEWIERRSALLSQHFRREFRLRAGVVLPYGYDDLSFPRRFWPTIYVIGGFGANHRAAADAAGALRAPEARGAIPQAVWVYLDADTPWGHSGFCDSETNGPIGRALVEELIPFLEERFRLVARPEARIVTGHSSGGWTAIHLALEHPEVFGAAFASAPDPVDFSAFGRIDLYRDHSAFVGRDGLETPVHRGPLGPNEDRVLMTVREEIGCERAIDPTGRSGQQWAAWNAMWSPFDPARGAPRPICDPETGAIDPIVGEAWSRHDLAWRFERDPDRFGPILLERVRIVCGTRDSFYLNEAVARLKAKIARWKATEEARGRDLADGPGSIELLEGLDHDGAAMAAQPRFHRGMLEHLRAHGLADPPDGRTSNPFLGGGAATGRDAMPTPAPAPR